MNILYLCDEYPPGRHGGIGTAVQLLAREMVKMGHTVVVAGFYDWGYGGEDCFEDQGVTVLRFRRDLDSAWLRDRDSVAVRAIYKLFTKAGIFQRDLKSSLARYRVFLEDVIRKYKIDLVEVPDFNEYVQFCTRYTPFPRLSVPTIVKLHTNLSLLYHANGKKVPGHFYHMDKHVLDQADHVSSVSDFVAEATRKYFKYTKPITTVYNGISIAEEKRVVKHPFRVVFAGSLVANKGIFQLMRAWPLVLEQVPEATLHVYGKGNVAKVVEGVAEQVLRSITFSGHIPSDQLHRAIAAASGAIFPSYFESFGLAVVEAMVCETAVIYTSRATGPELVRDGIDGLLVNPDDISEIAKKIVLLLKQPQLAAQIALTGRATVAERFDIKKVARKNFELYQEVLKKSSTT